MFSNLVKVLLSILKISMVLIVILSVVLLLPHFYKSYQQQKQGREWCDYLIADYDKDAEGFIDRHARDKTKQEYTFKPSGDFKSARGWFKVKSDSDYICRYWQDNLRDYQIYTYDGKAKQWTEEEGFDRFEGID